MPRPQHPSAARTSPSSTPAILTYFPLPCPSVRRTALFQQLLPLSPPSALTSTAAALVRSLTRPSTAYCPLPTPYSSDSFIDTRQDVSKPCLVGRPGTLLLPAGVSPKLIQDYAQVAGELRKMTAFIRQEALEKAREIQLKADEEFAIEKSKLVRQETAAIDNQYEKKFKQAAMSQQITRSTLANRTRLRVLSARQELLDDLFQRAREKISGVAAGDAKKYETVLKELVLEGLYALNEESIQVRGRKKDYDAIKRALEDAAKEFKDNVGKEVSVELDEEEPLPDGS
jgi:V-type H+-transporting ATPase subunit E